MVSLASPAPQARALTLVVAEYNFDTLGNPAPTFVGNGFTATSMSNNGLALFEVSNPTPNYPDPPVLRVAPQGGVTSSAAANAASGRFQFTVDSPTFNVFGLQTLTFDAGRGGGSTPRGFVLRTSETGSQELAVQAIPTQRPNFTGYSIDLSSIALLQDLSGPVTLSFHPFTPGTGASIEFDNFTLTATVPEPGRALLLGLATLPLLLRRRR